MNHNQSNLNNKKRETLESKNSNQKHSKKKKEVPENNTSETELLKIYLEELKEIPLASDSLKKELMLSASNGNQEARNQLTELYLIQAVQLAGTYCGQGVSLADLIQEANLGLMEAMLEKNITENQILATIETSLKRIIAKEQKEAKISKQIAIRLNTLSDAANELAKRHGKEPTTEELAEYLHIPVEEVQNDINLSLKVLNTTTPYQQS